MAERKIFNKRNDPEFKYVVRINPQLEKWRSLAAEWFKDQKRGRSVRRVAIDKFFLLYLHKLKLTMNPYSLLHRSYAAPSFWDVINPRNSCTNNYNNYASDFLDWILQTKLSVEDDYGRSVVPAEYRNPISRRYDRKLNHGETFRSPLPYRYIRELRGMLCQGPRFGDWKWAHNAVDNRTGRSDWFTVDRSLIDEGDQDCVWRKRKACGRELLEIWSPVRAVALYVKLMLPLRTHQVRMLDSGEADTWRHSNGRWDFNDGRLATGSEKRPYMRGVFHRSIDGGKTMTGFFINTNKTADINKDEKEKGYVIPWQLDELLYVLEKLRDWQGKYNPLKQPVKWTELAPKHNQHLPHRDDLEARGTACFLFRHAAAWNPKERALPLPDSLLNIMWHSLLGSLEKNCEKRGETLEDGSKIAFVCDVNRTSRKTYYPLHSLRVSLITAFALEGGVPFPILSKLIAGHSRLLMTLYYTKAGKAHVTEVMNGAEAALLETDKESYRRFLQNATYEQMETRFAVNNPAALFALSQQTAIPSAVFDDKGICPMGCGACDIGGDVIKDWKNGSNKTINAPVAGYPAEKNCVRCRFFLTGPAFLPGLVAHFNAVSYELTECAKRYVTFMDQVDDIEESRLRCEVNGHPFTRREELEKASKFCEQEAQKADKLVHDLRAMLKLIDRCVEILKSSTDEGVKLIPAGRVADIRYALKEVESEMHQLEVICENAVLYAETDASKATLRRSQILDSMLKINGRNPLLFTLTPEQQLHVGNHLMQLIKYRVGGLSAAVEVAEGKLLLTDLGLLDPACDLIERESGVRVIPMNAINSLSSAPQIELRGELHDAG